MFGKLLNRICQSMVQVALLFILFTSASCIGINANKPLSKSESLRTDNLRCEYLVNPLGIDVVKPRLSWISQSSRRGQKQTAYRVLVSSSNKKLEKNIGDLWDSGKMLSDQSTHIVYDGKGLTSSVKCFWKVMVWDKDGNASNWSEPAQWSMGPLKPEDWTAKWITMKVEEGLAHPWFRRNFELSSQPTRAEVCINTPSHYELYINGKKVGNKVLAPAHHQHQKRMLYNTYEVSSYLNKGRNCIALWMGPGWYQPRYGNPYKAPIVRVQMNVYSSKGLTTVSSDSKWRVHGSCISQIDNWGWNHMGGERWDSARYIENWNQVSFDDSGWAVAAEIPAPTPPKPDTTCQIAHSWQAMPSSRMGSSIKAKRVYAHKDKWMIDFGTTLTGWMHLHMSDLTPGQEVRIDYTDLPAEDKRFAFSKNADGFQTHNQADIYVAGSESQGVFLSKFNQHAFRYAVITGLTQKPALGDAEAIPVYSDLETAGQFSCSNELFNRIHQVTVNTCYSQIPCGVLGGGEAREKLGYGDGGSFLTGFLYNLRSDALYKKWLRDWRDTQRDDGFIRHTAPEFYPAGGGPSWGGQASELVRRLYVYYGDRGAISDSYTTLKKYLDYLESHTEEDILKYYNPYTPGKYVKWYFLGDWAPPGAGPDKHKFVFESAVQREFFNNCYRVLLWEHLVGFAGALGDKTEVIRCRKRLAKLRPLIHKTYYDPATKTYRANRQAYLTIALLSGIVPSELRPAIFKQLEDDIVIAKQGHLDTGLQGTFMLLDLLMRENRNDLIALMMSQTTFPGWGYLVKERNVTTWPETWSGWGSQVIQVVGTPGVWFYEGLAGIRPDRQQPGFKHFIIAPGVVKNVDWVKCSYLSPYGKIVSNWKVEEDTFKWNIHVPTNTTATVYLPGKNITEGQLPVAKAAGVTFLRMEKDKAVYKVESGDYEFKSVY